MGVAVVITIAWWWVIPIILIRYQVVWESVSMVLSTILILDNVHAHNAHG